MSLFTSFNAGVAGLASAQSGLNTTAHNLGNTKTPGYTRQQNIQADTYYQTLRYTDKSKMQTGYGVTVSEVRQIRDIFLDRQYRLEVGRQTFYESLYNTELEIEDILGEMEGVEFDNALSDFWNTVQTLSTEPESITNRELFIAKAEAFLEKATNAYNALKDYQVNLNKQISSQVDAINNIADQIAELNKKIAKAEASGVENANDYRDARNYLLDQLAEYTNYDAYEDDSGIVLVRIDNAPLVEEAMAYHMKCEKMDIEEYNEKTGQYEVTSKSPMYKVVWEGSGYGDVYDLSRAYSNEEGTDVGSLLGILTARGKATGFYTDIPVNPTERELRDYNNTTGNCLIEKVEAQFDFLIHKIVTVVNDAFAPNINAGLDGITTKDADGNTVTLSGITRVLDANRCPVGADDAATLGTEVFVRKAGSERYQVLTADGPVYAVDEDGNQILDEEGNPIEVTVKNEKGEYLLYVYQEEDPSDVNTLYTLQNLTINPLLQENYSYLPIMNNPATGGTNEYNYDVCAKILESWKAKDAVLDPNELATYGADEFYDALVGSLAVQGNVWKGIVEGQETLVESVEDKRQQVSGVSTEEEMTSLLMYQHAYNASSRYITVIDAMLEHLIERLG